MKLILAGCVALLLLTAGGALAVSEVTEYITSVAVPVGSITAGDLVSLQANDGNNMSIATGLYGTITSAHVRLRPNEDLSTQWSKSPACSSHTDCVDDPPGQGGSPSPSDGNTTIIVATANGQLDAFGLQQFSDIPYVPPSGSTIDWVSVHYVVRDNATPGPSYTWTLYRVYDAQICALDTDPDGSDSQAFHEISTPHVTNCDGNPITPTIVASMVVGFKRNSGTAAITITQVWLEAQFTVPLHTVRVYANATVGTLPPIRLEWNCTDTTDAGPIRLHVIQENGSLRLIRSIIPGMCIGTTDTAGLQASDLWGGSVHLFIWSPSAQGLPTGHVYLGLLVIVARNTIIEDTTNYLFIVVFIFFLGLLLVAAWKIKSRRSEFG